MHVFLPKWVEFFLGYVTKTTSFERIVITHSILLKKLRRKSRHYRRNGTSLHWSPLGVVTRKCYSKLRLINHLSWPKDFSVNNVIADSLRLSFLTMWSSALSGIWSLESSSPGSLMAKLNLKGHILIWAADWRHMGLTWHRKLYFCLVLTFGLWSAPRAVFCRGVALGKSTTYSCSPSSLSGRLLFDFSPLQLSRLSYSGEWSLTGEWLYWSLHNVLNVPFLVILIVFFVMSLHSISYWVYK